MPLRAGRGGHDERQERTQTAFTQPMAARLTSTSPGARRRIDVLEASTPGTLPLLVRLPLLGVVRVGLVGGCELVDGGS